MAEDSQSGEQPPQGSVFGNLPDARPGTRSPRRRSGDGESKRKRAAKTAAKAKAKPQPKAPSAPQAETESKPPQPPPSRPAPGAQTERDQGGGGIEDLAWAGVAAAAEAATLGVRLAGRALDALRGSSERD